MNIVKVAAAMLWASAALSAASPVDAKATTLQIGTYGLCAANNTPSSLTFCGQPYYYVQKITFVATHCYVGSCLTSYKTVNTDVVYSTGRKPATLDGFCGERNIYVLGACAC